jgi:hypothetical protein
MSEWLAVCGRPVSQPAGNRGLGFAASALLIFFGVAIAFVIGEIGVRLLGLGKPEFYAWSATRGWQLRAGAAAWQRDEARAFVRINRWGYRGPDWQRAKAAGTLRIAVLGDSFVEAQQVAEQETACAVIERTLTARLPGFEHWRNHPVKRVEVMNFGVDGYGTAQELFTLAQDAWRFSPDIVVLAFFPGNDVRNDSVVLEGDKCRPFFVSPDGTGFSLSSLRLGGPFEDSRLFRFQCFLRFESYRSQLLNLSGEARSALRSILRKRNIRQHPASGVDHHRPSLSSVGEPSINDLIYRPPMNQEWRDAWNVSDAEIEMVERDARSHGALFLAVIIGTGVQMLPHPAAQARYLRVVGGIDLLYPSHRLAALGARDGFAVLDLVPAMKSYAQANGVYFHGFSNTQMGTGHWNQRGNCFAGTMIANQLTAMMMQSSNGAGRISSSTLKSIDPAGACLG